MEQFTSGDIPYQKWLNMTPEEKIENTVEIIRQEYGQDAADLMDGGRNVFESNCDFVRNNSENIVKTIGREFVPNSLALVLSVYTADQNFTKINSKKLEEINDIFLKTDKKVTIKDIIRYTKLWIRMKNQDIINIDFGKGDIEDDNRGGESYDDFNESGEDDNIELEGESGGESDWF